jgi:hypothetical protein
LQKNSPLGEFIIVKDAEPGGLVPLEELDVFVELGVVAF